VDGTASNALNTICTVSVTFQPGYAGNRGVSLQVVTGTGTSAFGLSGIGPGPQVALSPGTIMTVAGNGTAGYSVDGGAATSAEPHIPFGMAVDGAGNLYIADQDNNRIRVVSAGTGFTSTVAGNGATAQELSSSITANRTWRAPIPVNLRKETDGSGGWSLLRNGTAVRGDRPSDSCQRCGRAEPARAQDRSERFPERRCRR
jgi:hypothetical protein